MSAQYRDAGAHFYDAGQKQNNRLMIALFLLAHEMGWLDVSDIETRGYPYTDWKVEWMGVELEAGTKEYDIASEMLYEHKHR